MGQRRTPLLAEWRVSSAVLVALAALLAAAFVLVAVLVALRTLLSALLAALALLLRILLAWLLLFLLAALRTLIAILIIAHFAFPPGMDFPSGIQPIPAIMRSASSSLIARIPELLRADALRLILLVHSSQRRIFYRP
jgi:hypothetical protein